MARGHISVLTDKNMQVNGKIQKDMDKEPEAGLMAESIKGNGRMEPGMAREYSFFLMAEHLWENLRWIIRGTSQDTTKPEKSLQSG